MTRVEFLENTNDFYELKDFCSEYGCDYCENVYDDDELDEEVEYDICEYHRNYSWRELRDYLYDIPIGYDFYRKNGILDYEGLDDEDFAAFREEVCDWAIENGYLDEDDEEEGEDFYDDEDDWFTPESQPIEEEEPVAEEDFSIGELMNMSVVMLVTLQQADTQRRSEADREFAEFISRNTPKTLV